MAFLASGSQAPDRFGLVLSKGAILLASAHNSQSNVLRQTINMMPLFGYNRRTDVNGERPLVGSKAIAGMARLERNF